MKKRIFQITRYMVKNGRLEASHKGHICKARDVELLEDMIEEKDERIKRQGKLIIELRAKCDYSSRLNGKLNAINNDIVTLVEALSKEDAVLISDCQKKIAHKLLPWWKQIVPVGEWWKR